MRVPRNYEWVEENCTVYSKQRIFLVDIPQEESGVRTEVISAIDTSSLLDRREGAAPNPCQCLCPRLEGVEGMGTSRVSV